MILWISMDQRLKLFVEQVCVIAVLVVYLSGFISIKPPASKLTMRWKPPEWLGSDDSGAGVEKTVIIVIDALRADHLTTASEPYMPYLHKLLAENKAQGYVVHTASPTVTLPRIKSLVTGSIPGFMDVIVNFGAQEMREDNLIERWDEKGRRIQFYGDDTWLKLFPTKFKEYDPVTSFFVSDYTEVDNNVTRHISSVLRLSRWEVLILHYLGLDHIGHLAGPQSPLILPKLKEMDTVIRDIHKKLLKQGKDFLILICGDHGMSDAGGHGGASLEEITTSAVFISNKLSKITVVDETIEQVSLAGTLALLTGIDIPTGNIGAPLPGVLAALDPVPRMAAHHKAAAQLLRAATVAKLPHTDPGLSLFVEANKLHQEVMKEHFSVGNDNLSLGSYSQRSVEAEDVSRVCALYGEAQKLLAQLLTYTLHNFDLPLIVASIAGILIVCIVNIIDSFYDRDPSYFNWKTLAIMCFIVVITWLCMCGSGLFGRTRMCDMNYYGAWLLVFTFTVSLQPLAIFIAQRASWKRKAYNNSGSRQRWLLQFLRCCSVAHIISLLSSSLVEEEHQTYYFFNNSLHVALILKLITYNGSIKCPKHSQETEEAEYEISNKKLYKKTVIRKCNCEIENKSVHENKITRIIFSQIILMSIVVNRLLRSWNATGDKWKHLTDLGDILRESDVRLLKCTVVFGIFLLFISFYKVPSSGILILLGCVGIYTRHFPLHIFGLEDGIRAAQYTYVLAVLIFISSFIKTLFTNKKTRDRGLLYTNIITHSYMSLSLVCCIIQRPENVCLFSIIIVHQSLVIKLLYMIQCEGWINSETVAICVDFMAGAYFFNQGNSNSLGSVDVSAGFVGVNFYSPLIHGTLITAHTFGGSILARISLLIHNKNSIRDCCNWETLAVWWKIRLGTLLLYVINVAAQRHHLFIWSVFTPKLLYEGAHLLILFSITIFIAVIEALAMYL